MTTETLIERISSAKTASAAAEVYADLIMATTGPEPVGASGISVPTVNAAILSRWSLNTFKTIKQQAWRIVDRRVLAAPSATLSF